MHGEFGHDLLTAEKEDILFSETVDTGSPTAFLQCKSKSQLQQLLQALIYENDINNAELSTKKTGVAQLNFDSNLVIRLFCLKFEKDVLVYKREKPDIYTSVLFSRNGEYSENTDLEDRMFATTTNQLVCYEHKDGQETFIWSPIKGGLMKDHFMKGRQLCFSYLQFCFLCHLNPEPFF